MIEATWHGAWRPVEFFVYDDMSQVVGPATELVGFEQRCGAVFRATPGGMKAASRHEAECLVCQKYKEKKA